MSLPTSNNEYDYKSKRVGLGWAWRATKLTGWSLHQIQLLIVYFQTIVVDVIFFVAVSYYRFWYGHVTDSNQHYHIGKFGSWLHSRLCGTRQTLMWVSICLLETVCLDHLKHTNVMNPVNSPLELHPPVCLCNQSYTSNQKASLCPWLLAAPPSYNMKHKSVRNSIPFFRGSNYNFGRKYPVIKRNSLFFPLCCCIWKLKLVKRRYKRPPGTTPLSSSPTFSHLCLLHSAAAAILSGSSELLTSLSASKATNSSTAPLTCSSLK